MNQKWILSIQRSVNVEILSSSLLQDRERYFKKYTLTRYRAHTCNPRLSGGKNRKITVQGQLSQKVNEIPSQPMKAGHAPVTPVKREA
jgi:hypothetical protein